MPVRLAPVMAHLGSYEEILAHVFHTSVLSSIKLPGESFINTKRTPQESLNKGDQVEQGSESFSGNLTPEYKMTEQHRLRKTLDSNSKQEKCCLFLSHTLFGVFIMKWPSPL